MDGESVLAEVPVSLPLDVSRDSALVAGVCDALEARGLVVKVRTAPFAMKELKEETGLSENQLYRMTEEGVFDRCGGTGKLLVTAGSVRRWQGFGDGKGGGK